jgi:hypothetical protein
MKRSEFLKRLGLGLGAAVAAPSLLKGEEEAPKSACNHVDAENGKELAFWRNDSNTCIPCADPTFLEGDWITLKQTGAFQKQVEVGPVPWTAKEWEHYRLKYE